jgi:peptidoglycan/LPS O-acetylase OafA/YrhL
MKASSLSFRLATLFAIAGMAMGIAMAASQDHSVMPAHAHLNLLGWVSLFLFGIYYRLHPATDASRLALVQVGVWSVGTVVLTIAVAIIHLGNPAADPIAAVGSLIVLAAMVLFAVLVYRPAAADRGASVALTPAE